MAAAFCRDRDSSLRLFITCINAESFPPSFLLPKIATCMTIIGLIVVFVHRVRQDNANDPGEVWQPLPRAVRKHALCIWIKLTTS